jgi:drug/metabolite transporter (DMT)-like permease
MKGASLEIRSLKGIIFILLSTLSFAGYSVLARILTKEFSSLELTTIMVVISFLCFNILVVGKLSATGEI